MEKTYDQLLQDFLGVLREDSYLSWVAMLAVAIVLTVTIKSALSVFRKRLHVLALKTEGHWDDLIVEMIGQIRGWMIFIWLAYPMLRIMGPHETVLKPAKDILVVATVFQFTLMGLRALRSWNENVLRRKIEADNSSAAVLGLLYLGVQTAFVSILILLGLSNLGINIGALLAGLGVGGIAVALAAQNILGDLLASLSIVLDKPFVVGDFVIVGSEMGTVEHIGIKTTRLRSISGEQLVLSNKDMLESRIRNFKRMWERRAVQRLGVTYDTPAEKLAAIPLMITEIFKSYPQLRLERCHFFQYGASSLDFEFVFFVCNPDMNVYMDFQQKVLLDIYRKFAEQKIDFAFPTQTVMLRQIEAPTS